MSDYQIRISGIREVQSALRSLNAGVADKVMLAALRTGANLISRAAKAIAPVKTGRLKRAIRVGKSKFNTIRRNGKAQIYLTVRKGKTRNDQKGAYYAGFVENGYKRGSRTVSGHQAVSLGVVSRHQFEQRQMQVAANRRYGHTRQKIRYRHGGTHIEGKHFIRNAFMQNKDSAVEIIIRNMESGTRDLAQRLGLNARS